MRKFIKKSDFGGQIRLLLVWLEDGFDELRRIC